MFLKRATLVESLAHIWLVWGLCYLFIGRFRETVDIVDTLWVEVVFLNIPLQLVLALAAWIADRSHRPAVRKVAVLVAVINTVLVFGHFAISLFVESRPAG